MTVTPTQRFELQDDEGAWYGDGVLFDDGSVIVSWKKPAPLRPSVQPGTVTNYASLRALHVHDADSLRRVPVERFRHQREDAP